MSIERGLDDTALDTSSAAVNEANALEACRGRSLEVLADNRGNVARQERVQVDLSRDGHPVGHGAGRCQPVGLAGAS